MKDQQPEIDEGFIPYLLEIQSPRIPYNPPQNIPRPIDYHPRYIHNQHLIRKQPSAILSADQQPPQLSLHPTQIQLTRHKKQQLYPEHPFDKYCLDTSYALIYSRNKSIQSIRNKDDNFQNQIPLQCITNYDQLHYSIIRQYQPTSHSTQLQFDSCFESGNLMWAFMHKDTPNEYTLFMQNDTNTYGYNQWFYFSIKNANINTKYKFNIVNFKNKHSFFKEGKQICIYSLKQSQLNNPYGWKYAGSNIVYGKSPIQIDNNQNTKFYSLSFELQFPFQNDCVFIAMNIPYSYSKLINRLTTLRQQANTKSIQWSQSIISHTIANNPVPYLTITNNPSSKRIILILARQHPGQTWSSVLLQSLLKSLLNQSNQSIWLLNNFIIKVFPMINIDGVIYGNFRCDLGGFDLNRQWNNPSKQLHPQIYHIKEQITKLSNNYSIECTLDLHGHSKQYNIFTYSCKNDNIHSRILPFMMNQLNQKFHFPSCTFGISKTKISTARAIISNITQTSNVHTIECSFFGTKLNGIKQPFTIHIIDQLANTINTALKQYFNQDTLKKQAQAIITTKIASLIDYQRNNPYKDDGSDSDPSQDQMDIKQKIGVLIPAKIVQKCYPQKLINSKAKILNRKKYITLQKTQLVKSKKNTQLKKQSQKKYFTKKSLIKKYTSKQDLSKEHLSKSLSKNYISITNKKQLINYNRSKTKNNNRTINNDQIYHINITHEECIVLNAPKSQLKNQIYSIKSKQIISEQKKLLKNMNVPNIKIGLLIDKQIKCKSALETQFPPINIFSQIIKKSSVQKINDKLKNKNNLTNNQRIKKEEEKTILNKLKMKLQQKSKKRSLDQSAKIWADNINRLSRENSKLHSNNY